eukprot:scaffold112_cov196-Amphora_coffeaeformis.AAC.3
MSEPLKSSATNATTATYSSKQGDPRVGQHLTEGLDGDVVFVLFACDTGVERNGGRLGARLGPARFLHFLKTMGSLKNPEYDDMDLSRIKLTYHHVDLTDQNNGPSRHEDELDVAHGRLQEAVSAVLNTGGLPFVVGGGNDQSYANWRSLRRFLGQHKQIGIINIDAHLDVRPVVNNKPNSGTPFRQILEEEANNGKDVKRGRDLHPGTLSSDTLLWDFAAQGSQCSRDHAEYVTSMGGSILWLKDVRDNATSEFERILDFQNQAGMDTFVSFDLDSIKASDCPGVSCPANVGLTSDDALGIMMAAGKASHVKLVDMSELNPAVENYITPRLAVQMAYHFLLGFCQRKRRNAQYRLRISNLSQLIRVEDVQGQGFRTGEHMSHLSVIVDGTILVDNQGLIAYVGSSDCAPSIDPSDVEVDLDGRGKAAIPGLCDAHTHPVWAGDRVHEFALKLAGASYMDIHKQGGGINLTVKHTREADEETLYHTFVGRLNRMHANGTTLVECKSGYGLNTATEMKMLRVIEQAQQLQSSIDIVGNFCGAHSIPQGMTEEQALTAVLNEMIPTLRREQTNGTLNSVKLIDVFAEAGVFSNASAEMILEAGAKIGLLGNFHGDELSYQACGELAAKKNCRAVSHLEHVSDQGIVAMKESNTAAVLLPTTAFVLRITPPPARKLIDSGVAVALGTDFNPNAFCLSMPHAMNLACITMHMTVEEALVAGTLNAAYSMGKEKSHGSLETGKRGDIVLVNGSWENIIYQFGSAPPIHAVIKDGVPMYV